jgi:hypothetical protein
MMRQPHGDEILATDDVGRIPRIKVCRINHRGGKSFFVENRRFLPRKCERIRPKDGAAAVKAPNGQAKRDLLIDAPNVYFGSPILPSRTRPHWVSSM